MNPVTRKLILYLMLSIVLVGCVPTIQLQNEGSERYFASPNSEAKMLEGNRANGVLILVRTGYFQRNNQNQLSIYLECDFAEPHSTRLLSAELVDSNNLRLDAGDLGLDCPESVRGTASPKGTGYLHFYGEGVSKLTLDETLMLNVFIEVKDVVYELSLPLTSTRVWVSPT